MKMDGQWMMDYCHTNTMFIQVRLCKFKDFSRTSQRLSYRFQELKTYEKNTDLHVKILLLKC